MLRLRSLVLSRRPINPSALGVLRHSKIAASMSSSLAKHFSSRYLADFTADSASPFDEGLPGELVLCSMRCSWQNRVKSPRNYGPLSENTTLGYPKEFISFSRHWITALVSSFWREKTHKYPENRSTATR